MKKYIAGIAVALVCGLFVTSCGSKRTAVSSADVTGKVAATPYSRMIDTYSDWTTLSCPAKMRIESPVVFSFSGKLYMNRENVIHMSMRLLGMEFGVVRAERDSVFCIDKLHRVVVAESMERVTTMTGLTMGQLQDVLMGRWIAPDKPDGCKLAGNEYGYVIDESVDQLSSIKVKLPTGKSVECSYSDWENCRLGFMPEQLASGLQLAGRTFAAKLIYTPGSANVDRDDMPSFKLPGNYRRVTVAEFLTTMKSF